MISSREKITTTTHAATSPSWTSTIRTDSTNSLSASGSRNLPKSLTVPRRRASSPSRVSVSEKRTNNAAATWSCPGKRNSNSAISTGIASRRLTVRLLGMFIARLGRSLALFDAEPLQQIVDVGKRHQDLARLGSLIAADHAMLGELVDDPAGPGITDVELALHERDRRRAFGRHRTRGPREKGIQLAFLPPLASLPFGHGALFEDLFHVAGSSLRLPEADHAIDLWIADESALDACRLACIDGLVEHVAATEKLFRTAGVEDDAAVDLRADSKRYAGGNVGLDQTRDDVCRRALRGDDQVNADGAGKLRDAADQLFDLTGGDHHQVGQLVDHDHDVRQPPGELLRGLVVVGGDVPHTLGRKQLVTTIHLRHGPAQGRRGLVRFDQHGQSEMRQAVVAGQLDALGVDQEKTHVFGRDLEQQAGDERVDADALALARRAGDEQVRHAREVGDDRLARDVVAKAQRELVASLAKRGGFDDLANRDEARRLVRHLDAHS